MVVLVVCCFGFALCDGGFFIVMNWFIVQLLGFTVTAGIG